MKKLLLFVLGVIVIAGIVVAIVAGGHKKSAAIPKLYETNIIARNLQFAGRPENGQIPFYTGTALAKYDFGSNTSTSLTPEENFGAVTAVRWSTDYALVKAGSWKVVTLRATQPANRDLGSGVIDAIWSASNSASVLTASTTGNRVEITESTPQGTVTSSQAAALPETADLQLLAKTGRGIVIAAGQKIWLVENSRASQIGTYTGQITNFLTVSDSHILFTASSANGSLAYGIDLQAGKVSAIVSAGTGQAVDLSPSAIVLVGQTIKLLDPQSGQLDTELPLVKAGDRAGQPAKIYLTKENPAELFVVTQANDLQYITTSQTKANGFLGAPLIPFQNIVTQLASGGLVQYDFQTNTAYISLAQITPQTQQQALNDIRAMKVDPNQLKKVWRSPIPAE